MLTGTERRGCLDLLKRLTLTELWSLKDTVTKRQISAVDRSEAMEAILDYSVSSIELLHRKKMRREVLFQYLAEKGVVVSINSEKVILIDEVLMYWHSSVPTYDLADNDTTAEATIAAPQTTQRDAALEVAPATVDVLPLTDAPAAMNPLVAAVHQTDAAVGLPLATQSSVDPNQHQMLGEKFVEWFYKLLNAENPMVGGANDGDSFGPQHFLENCALKLVTKTTEVKEERFEGNVLVAQRLAALSREEFLLFNPNINSDGVRVLSDPHGLIIVMACGTIHRHDDCLGVFEQLFGIVRCPLNKNNWRVKVSQMHLTSGQVTVIPRLTESSANELLPITALCHGYTFWGSPRCAPQIGQQWVMFACGNAFLITSPRGRYPSELQMMHETDRYVKKQEDKQVTSNLVV